MVDTPHITLRIPGLGEVDTEFGVPIVAPSTIVESAINPL